MDHGDPIDQLIDSLYENAVSTVDECVWCDLLPAFCSTFEATAGGLVAHDFVSGTATLRHGYHVDTRCRGHYEGDPSGRTSVPDGLSRYREGAVFLGDDATSRDEVIDADPCLSCLDRPHSNHLYGMISRERGTGYLISLMRPVGAEPFDDDDKSVLARVLPHLKRSLRLRDEVVIGRFERESLLDLMDQLPVAVLLVTRSGLVRVRNQAAEDLLGQRDGICLRSGYLAGSTARATTELRRLVANAATRPAGGDVASAGEHFVIPRGADRLPLISVAFPGRVGDGGVAGRAEPMAVLLIKDPQIDSAQSLTDFVNVYEITNAEARLLRFLCDGHGLFEAARELAISKNTARTHMRSIYAKVGTHRQSDLVRLLHRFTLF
jgi:DNA-binding CsgD family transcriptional regulator/PAS domain-containing protein